MVAADLLKYRRMEHPCDLKGYAIYREDEAPYAYTTSGAQKEICVAVNYHQRLVDALRNDVDQRVCTCKFLGYIGRKPPCPVCKLRTLLAEIEKVGS